MPRRLGVSSGSSEPVVAARVEEAVVDIDAARAAAEPRDEERPVDVSPVMAGRAGEPERTGARAEDLRRIEQHVAIGDEKELLLVHPALLEVEHQARQGLLLAQNAARRKPAGRGQVRHPRFEAGADSGAQRADQPFRLVPLAGAGEHGRQGEPGEPQPPMRLRVARLQPDLEPAIDAAGDAELDKRGARPFEQAAHLFQPGAQGDRIGAGGRCPQPLRIARRDGAADRRARIGAGERRQPRQNGKSGSGADMADRPDPRSRSDGRFPPSRPARSGLRRPRRDRPRPADATVRGSRHEHSPCPPP